MSLPGFAVLVVATTVVITALVNAASGSVLIAAVFHSSFDAFYAYTGVVGGNPALLWIAATLTTVVATAITGGRLCARVPDRLDHPGPAGHLGRVPMTTTTADATTPGTRLLGYRDRLNCTGTVPLLSDLVLGTVYFTVLVTLLALSAGLVVTVVGISGRRAAWC
jgi:hypothetical protein